MMLVKCHDWSLVHFLAASLELELQRVLWLHREHGGNLPVCVFSVLGLLIFEVPAAKWRNACAALCLPDTTADVYICVCSVVSNSLRPHGLSPTRLLCPRDSPGKNAGLGCHALLQGIFPTWGLNLHLLCLLRWQGVFTSSATWEAH